MYRDIFTDMAERINDTLGHVCTYTDVDGEVFEDVSITINAGKPVVTEFDVIAGSIVEGGILRIDIPSPQPGDTFTDDLDRTWQVDGINRVVTAKTYVHLTEVFQ